MADRLAIVTGASTGIGFELATLAAKGGHDLIVAADEPGIVEAANTIASLGVAVERRGIRVVLRFDLED